MKSVLLYWIEVFKNTFLRFVFDNLYLDTHILIVCGLEANILRGIDNLFAQKKLQITFS